MIYRFDGFELDAESEELSKGGQLLPLAPQPCRVLSFLVANSGRTVSRNEIRQHVWRDNHVEADVGLNSCIRKIRAQLNDDATHPRYVKTLPRRGYRFVGSLEGETEDPAPATSPGTRAIWALLALAALVAVALGLYAFREKASLSTPPGDPGTSQKTVAVLPFDNLTADPAQDFLSEGLTEETIARLSRFAPNSLAVIARTTAMQFKDSPRDVIATAQKLDVTHLVEGSVRSDDGRLRATVRLVDGATGLQLETDSFEAPTGDLLDAQISIADRIASFLAAELITDSDLDSNPLPALPDPTYELYLKALYRLQEGSADGYLQAREHFSEVVRLAPEFAPGWVGLSEANLWMRWFGADDEVEVLERSREAAERAIELDPHLASPHLLLGYADLYVHHRLPSAGERLATAVELEPGSARAQSWYAAYLAAVGNHGEAVERAERARRLDPLAMAVNADLCWLKVYSHQFESALDACSNALELTPGDVWTALGKVEALRQLSRTEEAVATLSAIATTLGAENIGDAWARRAETDPEGALQDALLWLDSVASRNPRPFFAASTAALLGDPDRALVLLRQALDNRDALVIFAAVDPRFDTLHARPEFQALMADLGLSTG